MIEKKIEKLISPLAIEHKINIYKVLFEKEDSEYFLRVLIEKDDLTMDIATCESFSEKISPLLDKEDIIKESYYLDVSSPGSIREYEQKNLKKMITWYLEIKTKKPYLKDEYVLKGHLNKNNDENILLRVNQKGRFRNIKIEKEDIVSIKLAYKI